MWLLAVCATDVLAAGTPADSAWVQDTGGVLSRAAFAPPSTGDTGDSADSAESGDTGSPGTADTDTDTDVATDTDPDTDADTDAVGGTDDGGTDGDDDGEDVGCCGSGGSESSAILGVGLALAVVLGRRRIELPASPSGKASND